MPLRLNGRSVIAPGVVHTELRDNIAHAGVQAGVRQWAQSVRPLQARDVAQTILFCVTRPDHGNINEVLLRPTDQEC